LSVQRCPNQPTLTPTVANNFWGKDDAGYTPLLDRMHNAKVSNDELKAFYTSEMLLQEAFAVLTAAARAAIEEEYARKLLSLARKPLGSGESGSLRMSLDVMRREVESMAKGHQHIAQQMKTELEEPLAAFAGGMKERRKIVQSGIEKLHKLKCQQTAAVNKVGCLGLALLSNGNSLATDMNKIASRSKAIWPKDTWLWARKRGRSMPNWKRPRSKCQARARNTKPRSRRSKRQPGAGTATGRPRAT